MNNFIFTQNRKDAKFRVSARWIYFCMALALLSFTAIPAYAASDDWKIGNTPYATLEAAVAAVSSGGTITLQRNLVVNGGITLDRAQTYTIDFKGYELSGDASGTLLVIYGGGNVTLQNGNLTTSAGVALNVSGSQTVVNILSGNYSASDDAAYTYSGTIIITSGRFRAMNGSDGAIRAAGTGVIKCADGSGANVADWYGVNDITVKPFDFKIVNRLGTKFYITLEQAVAAAYGGDIIEMLHDVELSATADLSEDKTYTLDFGGHKLSLSNSGSANLLLIRKGNVTLQNGVLSAPYTYGADNTGQVAVFVSTSATVTILSGDYTGYRSAVHAAANTIIVAGRFRSTQVGALNSSGISIGPDSITDPESWQGAKDVTVTVQGAGFKIGDMIYNTLEEAAADVKDGETIEMLRNVGLLETAKLRADKTYTIDFGGYTLSGNGDIIMVYNGNVTFQNGAMRAGDTAILVMFDTAVKILSGDYFGVRYAVFSNGNTLIRAGTFQNDEYRPLNRSTEGVISLWEGSTASPDLSSWSKKVNIWAAQLTTVSFTATQTDGASGTANSTGIVLTFSQPVTGLTANDITVADGTGAVVKGSLSGSGTTWTIGLTSVATEGNVTINVGDFGLYDVTNAAQTVAVYKNTAGSGDTTAPLLSSGSVNRTSDTEAAIGFTTDEAGTAYYIVQNSGTAKPDKATVAAGTSLGAVTSGANSDKAITLTAGAKDIYVVVKDATGNISEPLKIEVAAYTGPTYGVSIATLEHGTVSAGKADYTAGETVTLTITPENNFELQSVSVAKTGDPTATVSLTVVDATTQTFTMPAYGVTVTATFQKTADQTAVETAKGLIESMSNVTVAQATANTEATVKTWLAAQINALSGMSATGIAVTASHITLSNFNTAVAGIQGMPAGTSGSFTFTVSLVKGGSNATTANKNGVITATSYNPSAHAVTIAPSGNGTVTPSATNPAEGNTVTLTIAPAAGYELKTISACKTGDAATTVALTVVNGTTQTFTMPAYDVTVTATFKKTQATLDAEAVATAKAAIEGASGWTVAQATANTEAAVKTWLATQINALSGVGATGITIAASNITISNFKAAVAGTAGSPSGTNGSFTFTVSLAKGSSSATTTSKAGTVTATSYIPSAYGVTVNTTANGTLTANPASATAGTTVTLTASPAIGFELASISVVRADDQTAVTVSGSGSTRTFIMPACNVTVTATFKKTQAQLDKEAVEAAKAAVEGGTFRIAQATGNTETTVKAWLVNTLNILFGQSYGVEFRAAAAEPIIGEGKITAITPAITGTQTVPNGTDGTFKFTVTLTKGATMLTTDEVPGVIVATPYEVTPVKRIEIFLLNELTVRILNTGNVATGNLTLALSGTNADVFTLPATASSLAVGGETEITLSPRADLAQGVYTATLTVSAEGIAPVQVEITYTITPTGMDDIPQAKPLKAYMRNGRLHVEGLTAGKSWSVYSVSGTPVYQGKATGEEADVSLTVRGVYIVVSEGRSVKAVY